MVPHSLPPVSCPVPVGVCDQLRLLGSVSLELLHQTLSHATQEAAWGVLCPVLIARLGDAVRVGVLDGGSGEGCPEVLLRPQPRGGRREHSSAESLMECILESFAFLNADFAPHELSLFGGPQGPR